MNGDEIIQLMNKIRQEQSKISFVDLDTQAMQDGLKISRQALSQPEDVSLTPYSKNALLKLDNIGYLKVDDPTTKMEKYYELETLKLLKKYCGRKRLEYDMQSDPGSPDHYAVDCGRNFKEGSKVRHVHKGMNEEREINFSKFYKPIRDVNFVEHYHRHKKVGQITLSILDKAIPNVRSSDKFEEVNLPFMNKHTNVGYPYFRNDRSIDAKSGLTYGQLTSKIAKGLKPQEVVNYPYIAFGRNLRGKARPILGGSRIQALVYNQLESQEIQVYKSQSPLFIGYNDDKVLKDKLVVLGKYLMRNKNLTCMNRDYSAFDTTVNPTWRRLVDAISIIKTVDNRGKQIAFGRGVSHRSSLLINGLVNKVKSIYCRIFSGELDTNRGGGLVNAIADVFVICMMFPPYQRIFNELQKLGSSALLVMGDDNLLIQPRTLDNHKFSSIIKDKFDLDVSHEKGEYGLYFLQRRLFYKDGKGIMITPFTRIIRSLISKENRKGLGPAGGTIATYMLLHQLIEGPELMIDVARIFARFDEYRLGTVWTVKQMIKLVSEEDQKAVSEDKKSLATHIKLYDGDPMKEQLFNDDGSMNETFLGKIHSILLQGLKRDL